MLPLSTKLDDYSRRQLPGAATKRQRKRRQAHKANDTYMYMYWLQFSAVVSKLAAHVTAAVSKLTANATTAVRKLALIVYWLINLVRKKLELIVYWLMKLLRKRLFICKLRLQLCLNFIYMWVIQWQLRVIQLFPWRLPTNFTVLKMYLCLVYNGLKMLYLRLALRWQRLLRRLDAMPRWHIRLRLRLGANLIEGHATVCINDYIDCPVHHSLFTFHAITHTHTKTTGHFIVSIFAMDIVFCML